MPPRSTSLHIVYGIPCAGKSTTAVAFAYHQKIRTVIHTDYIREVQRGFDSRERNPALAKVTHDAWELHGPPTRQNIEAGFVDHVKEVAIGVKIVASKLLTDGFDAVIEGTHFYSSVIEDLRVANRLAQVHPTLLVVHTAEELLERADRKNRERRSGATEKRWRDRVPILLTIQDFLITDARTHGIHVTTADEWRGSWLRDQSDHST